MQSIKTTLCFVAAISVSGCASTKLPSTLGENSSSFSYIPLDPLPVGESRGKDCEIVDRKYKELLDSLPDQAVRIAVGKYNTSGTLVYGPVSVGVAGERYQIVLDYISVDATNRQLTVQKSTKPTPPSVWRRAFIPWTIRDGDHFKTSYRLVSSESINEISGAKYFGATLSDPNYEAIIYPPEVITIPVYIGVGLRLTANVVVTEGTASLSSLGALSAAAEAGSVSGSLVVQTLGITGKSISTTLPLPSEINPTTIQNAILALGSIKAVLYENGTVISPRVVGFYNPVGGGSQFVNSIISNLASNSPDWPRPCSIKIPNNQTQPTEQPGG